MSLFHQLGLKTITPKDLAEEIRRYEYRPPPLLRAREYGELLALEDGLVVARCVGRRQEGGVWHVRCLVLHSEVPWRRHFQPDQVVSALPHECCPALLPLLARLAELQCRPRGRGDVEPEVERGVGGGRGTAPEDGAGRLGVDQPGLGEGPEHPEGRGQQVP